MQKWIEANFVVDGDNFIVIDDPITKAPINWFIETFRSAFKDGTFRYDDLTPLVRETGWKLCFDMWKKKGILS